MWFADKRALAPPLSQQGEGIPGQRATLACLAVLAALAWLALVGIAELMSMPDMDEAQMQPTAWTAADFALRLAMWVTMMIGMMLPSATPMILLFRRVARDRTHAAARVAWFTFAYVLVWSVFSLAATLLQEALELAAWLSPMSMRGVPWLSGGLLVLAGIYQWLPAKNACLAHCRSPLGFLLRYPPAGWRGSLRLGIAHGLYCVGCCWALMLVLFAVGAMNLLWALAIGAFVLAEKLTRGPWLPHLAGAGLIAAGLAIWLRLAV